MFLDPGTSYQGAVITSHSYIKEYSVLNMYALGVGDVAY